MGNKHVISDLYQMQSLPLNAKVRMTQWRIREWVDEYGEDGVYISFSGGKDSTVLLDIARKLYPNIKATGGEPMINPAQLYTVIKMLRKQNKRQKIYLYTACLTMDDHPVILKHLDGITVTVHAEATDEDIRNLKYMSSNLYDEDLDMRLFIDKRVYDRYDLSNICMKTWDVVRKLEWKEKCDPAENEELFLWNLY